MRFTAAISLALTIGAITFINAAPSSEFTNLQFARNSIPVNDAIVFRRDDDDREMKTRDVTFEAAQNDNILPRADSIYAQLCDSNGNNCSGSYSLTNPVCWYRRGKKTLKIHSSIWYPQEHFILFTVAPDGVCPGSTIDNQFFGKVHNGQLINIESNGFKFYFDTIYFGE